MRAQEILNEYTGMDRPYKIERDPVNPYIYTANIEGTTKILMIQYFDIVSSYISLRNNFIPNLNHLLWEISFGIRQTQGEPLNWKPEAPGGSTQAKQNAVILPRILSTITASMDEFVNDLGIVPQFVCYIPSTDRLGQLYTRIAPRLMSKFGYQSVDSERVEQYFSEMSGQQDEVGDFFAMHINRHSYRFFERTR
jgi:hypothetical protein